MKGVMDPKIGGGYLENCIVVIWDLSSKHLSEKFSIKFDLHR
jgi:hypothetical protein